jgi:hypothetical protein
MPRKRNSLHKDVSTGEGIGDQKACSTPTRKAPAHPHFCRKITCECPKDKRFAGFATIPPILYLTEAAESALSCSCCGVSHQSKRPVNGETAAKAATTERLK